MPEEQSLEEMRNEILKNDKLYCHFSCPEARPYSGLFYQVNQLVDEIKSDTTSNLTKHEILSEKYLESLEQYNLDWPMMQLYEANYLAKQLVKDYKDDSNKKDAKDAKYEAIATLKKFIKENEKKFNRLFWNKMSNDDKQKFINDFYQSIIAVELTSHTKH